MFIESFSQPVLFSSAIWASFSAWMFCTDPNARTDRPSSFSMWPITRIQMRRF